MCHTDITRTAVAKFNFDPPWNQATITCYDHEDFRPYYTYKTFIPAFTTFYHCVTVLYAGVWPGTGCSLVCQTICFDRLSLFGTSCPTQSELYTKPHLGDRVISARAELLLTPWAQSHPFVTPARDLWIAEPIHKPRAVVIVPVVCLNCS